MPCCNNLSCSTETQFFEAHVKKQELNPPEPSLATTCITPCPHQLAECSVAHNVTLTFDLLNKPPIFFFLRVFWLSYKWQ